MNKHVSLSMVSVVVAAACGGGGGGGSPDASRHDSSPGDGSSGASPTAVVAAGDFMAGDPGILSSFSIASRTVTQGVAPQGAVGDNPVVRHIGSELFIINSADGNNVTILDDSTFTLVEQLATGSGTNPQDVAEVGTKLYVPTYVGSGVDVLTRGTTTSTIVDLSADDPDGNPNCNSAFAVGSDVYVTCDLLDNSMMFPPPRGSGEVFVIDSTTDTVRTKFFLTTENPVTLIESIGNGNLAVSTDNFETGSGCVEQITTGTTPASGGCIVNNSQLDGDANRLQFQSRPGSSTLLWMSVISPDFSVGQLLSYDLTSNALSAPLSGSNEVIVDVGLCPDGSLVAVDASQGNGSGLRLYQDGAEVTTSALSIGEPPNESHDIVCY